MLLHIQRLYCKVTILSKKTYNLSQSDSRLENNTSFVESQNLAAIPAKVNHSTLDVDYDPTTSPSWNISQNNTMVGTELTQESYESQQNQPTSVQDLSQVDTMSSLIVPNYDSSQRFDNISTSSSLINHKSKNYSNNLGPYCANRRASNSVIESFFSPQQNEVSPKIKPTPISDISSEHIRPSTTIGFSPHSNTTSQTCLIGKESFLPTNTNREYELKECQANQNSLKIKHTLFPLRNQTHIMEIDKEVRKEHIDNPNEGINDAKKGNFQGITSNIKCQLPYTAANFQDSNQTVGDKIVSTSSVIYSHLANKAKPVEDNIQNRIKKIVNEPEFWKLVDEIEKQWPEFIEN